jgi:hypothetical protein
MHPKGDASTGLDGGCFCNTLFISRRFLSALQALRTHFFAPFRFLEVLMPDPWSARIGRNMNALQVGRWRLLTSRSQNAVNNNLRSFLRDRSAQRALGPNLSRDK